MNTTYSQKASEFVSEILVVIFPILVSGKYEKEINYTKCTVEILDNDALTIWVKWGNYDCQFKDLPITAMATIADNILRDNE